MDRRSYQRCDEGVAVGPHLLSFFKTETGFLNHLFGPCDTSVAGGFLFSADLPIPNKALIKTDAHLQE